MDVGWSVCHKYWVIITQANLTSTVTFFMFFFLIFLHTTLHIVTLSYPYEEKNRIFLMITFFLSSEISCRLQDSLGAWPLLIESIVAWQWYDGLEYIVAICIGCLFWLQGKIALSFLRGRPFMILRRGEDFHQLIFFLVSLGFQFLHGDLPNSETPSCKLQCIFLICLFLNLFTGPGDKHEFQAETRKLLDIVAKSLYSEKEVCHQNNILLF